MSIFREALQTEAEGNIRSDLLKEMQIQGYNFSSFSKKAGINRGILSAVFNGSPPKPISIRLLDRMGKVFGYPEGWLYEEYVEECFHEGKTHWRRLRAFLLRCIELNRLELVDKVLFQVMEETMRLQDVFMLGEELFAEGKQKESIPFYRCVVENEIKQHSERMAISQYKWFRARLGLDLEKNREAAQQFYPFRNRLPEHFQLDGLLQLANVYFILQKWEDVQHIADELRAVTLICFHQENGHSRNRMRVQIPFATERHLVVYYGQSLLLKGNALEKQGYYKQAFTYISDYEDLSWFDSLDETGWREVEKFKMYAEANRANLHLLMGNFEFLPDYVALLDKHPSELLSGLLTILEAANQYHYNIDHVLFHFRKTIHLLQTDSLDHSFYSNSFTVDRQANFFHKLALYSLNHTRIEEGIGYLLKALNSSIKANNQNLSIACAAWFEQFRQQAAFRQKEIYESIMKGVIEDEQMDHVAFNRCHCQLG
ncbi:MAG: DNA-binding protein [Gorillibacterium sp.]|nr:DNA-binding protein [Gorillibacterium sp.]